MKKFVSKPLFDEKIILKKDNCFPKISIVTPSYNQGQFIEQTILSVKNQNYPNIEHIIIDGGSKDGTIDILKKYHGTYNMYWVSEPDKGQSDAINKGFKLCTGEIVGWINSDDLYSDINVFNDIAKFFYYNPYVDIIYGNITVIDSSGMLLEIYHPPKFNYRLLLAINFIPQPSVFIRKIIIENNKLRESLHFSMDHEFWLRLGKRYCFKSMNRIIAAFRVHNQSKTRSKANEMRKEIFLVIKEYDDINFTNQSINRLLSFLFYKYMTIFGPIRALISCRYKQSLMPNLIKSDNRIILKHLLSIFILSKFKLFKRFIFRKS